MRYLSINLEGGRVLSHFDCFFSLFLMRFKQSWAREREIFSTYDQNHGVFKNKIKI